MKKLLLSILIISIALWWLFLYFHAVPVDELGAISKYIGPAYLYPSAKTPCEADTLDPKALQKRYNGLTYSQAHRNVTKATIHQVDLNYPTTTPRNLGEYDHCWPVSGGGKNGPENIWWQPLHNDWNGRNFGYKEKDKLEAWIARGIKDGSVNPKEAFKKMRNDWVAYDLEVFGNRLGGLGKEVIDPDNE